VSRRCPEDLKPEAGSSWDIADFMVLETLHSGAPAGLNVLLLGGAAAGRPGCLPACRHSGQH
jgi:hypothetical protein